MTVGTEQQAASPQPLAARARRRRRWLIVGGVVAVIGLSVLADWPHRATAPQRRADFTAYRDAVRVDIGSCAIGVASSISAFNKIQAGASTDVSTAIGIAHQAALDCTPPGNSQVLALSSLEPPRSLAQYGLASAPTTLSQWAYPDGVAVCQELAAALSAHRSGVPPGVIHWLSDMQSRASAAQATMDRAARGVGAPVTSLGLSGIGPSAVVG